MYLPKMKSPIISTLTWMAMSSSVLTLAAHMQYIPLILLSALIPTTGSIQKQINPQFLLPATARAPVLTKPLRQLCRSALPRKNMILKQLRKLLRLCWHIPIIGPMAWQKPRSLPLSIIRVQMAAAATTIVFTIRKIWRIQATIWHSLILLKVVNIL